MKEEEENSHPKSCSFNIGGSNGEMTSILNKGVSKVWKLQSWEYIKKMQKKSNFLGDMASQQGPSQLFLKNLHFECTHNQFFAIEILYYMHKVLFEATNELIVGNV